MAMTKSGSEGEDDIPNNGTRKAYRKRVDHSIKLGRILEVVGCMC